VRVLRWPHPVYVRGGTSTDSAVLYELLVTGEYDLVADLGSPKFIIDGGANIGATSVYFLQLYPSVRIIAVEPFAETLEVCEKNLAPYAGRAQVVHGAIWSHTGTVVLHREDEEWANKVREPLSGETGTAAAKAFSMAELIALRGESVDLLKLDIEGGEKEVFRPGTTDWLACIRNLVIELHDQECADRFWAAMAPYEYELSSKDKVYFCRNLRPRTQEAVPLQDR